MKTYIEDFKKIYFEERWMLIFMLLNLAFSIFVFVFSITHLNPNSAVAKIGYGDIGGYRDGGWVDILSYPLLAFVFGVLHSLLAVRIFHKRGSGTCGRQAGAGLPRLHAGIALRQGARHEARAGRTGT